jgi:purine catabolism regulator
MALTLAQLVADPSLSLTVSAGGEERLGTEVRWVHVSELSDPTEYLEGGELLLLTGMGLKAGSMSEYVQRLVETGVVGLGFGVGLVHRTVPAALRKACDQHGLPLLVVPRPVPFLAISKAVASAVAREQYETLAAAYDAQHALTRAALDPDGAAAVVTTLARLIGGWAVLTDAAGRPVHAQPAAARQRAAALKGELARLRGHGPRSSAALAEGGREVVIQGLGAGGRLRGFLAAGTEGRLSAVDRTVVTLAVPLLALALERSRRLAGAERSLRAAVLDLALTGAGAVRATAALLIGPAVEGDWLVAVVAPVTEEPGESLVAALEDALPPALIRLDTQAVVVAVPAGTDALQALIARRTDLVAGVSSAHPFAQLATAYDEADRALAVARRDERRIVPYAEITEGGLLGLLAGDAVRAYADALLAPLAEYGAQARGSLVESLRVWLAHNGQWDTAAAELGVHRHTLRYRMSRVERLLGRPLSDGGTRMELWLALSATAGQRPAN